MWKALLVEDEPVVRRTLAGLIDWEANGFRLVGEAGDGEQALAMIESERPDLVIADIVMPRMDGLTLLEKTKLTGLEPVFVMLTCMNEFEYARRALELGAAGYVLKLSVSPASLAGTLEKVGAELAKRYREKTELAYHRRYALAWEALAEGNDAAVPPGAEDEPAGPVPEERFDRVWIGCSLRGEPPEHPGGAAAIGVTHTFRAAGIATRFIWSAASAARARTRSEADRDAASLAVAEGPAGCWEMLWRDALSRLDDRWYGGDGDSAARPGSGGGDGGPEPGGRMRARELELLVSAERDAGPETIRLLRELWNAMRAQHVPAYRVKACALGFVRYMEPLLGPAAQEALRALREAERHEALLAGLEAAFAAYARKRLERELPRTDHPEVNALLRHIHACYAEPLTLKASAELVRMDESYLSGLFRKKTGVPFIRYVQQVRVEQAKRLLVQTDLPVQAVGEKVGFPNANYFFKLFKKMTGRTPNDYRSGRPEQ